jgi:hypothetical protein
MPTWVGALLVGMRKIGAPRNEGMPRPVGQRNVWFSEVNAFR